MERDWNGGEIVRLPHHAIYHSKLDSHHLQPKKIKHLKG